VLGIKSERKEENRNILENYIIKGFTDLTHLVVLMYIACIRKQEIPT
jgi:hypothetical protein